MKLNDTYFGNWKIDRRIGSGSYGSVYRLAKHDEGGDYYSAMKVISVGGEDGTESCLKGVMSEFALMSKLKGNSNIVNCEDHDIIRHSEDGGFDILIRMEILEPLPKYERHHKFSRKDIIKLGIDMCTALSLCENHSVIHRDIKPENIFVSPDGNYKLGDFGIARTLDKNLTSMSRKGTYAYMAPEVYKGENYNTTADIYSLGIVLYRFFNGGMTPFLNDEHNSGEDREEAVRKRMNGEKIPILDESDPLLKIILKACAYKPSDRYASAEDMKNELIALPAEEKKEKPSGILTRLSSDKKFTTAMKILIFAAAAAVIALIIFLIT